MLGKHGSWGSGVANASNHDVWIVSRLERAWRVTLTSGLLQNDGRVIPGIRNIALMQVSGTEVLVPKASDVRRTEGESLVFLLFACALRQKHQD